MSWRELGIEHKRVGETLAATIRIALGSRENLPGILVTLAHRISRENITGPPFCIIRFITSVTDGFDAEIGFPVRHAIETEGLRTRVFPPLHVLSLTHTGPLESLGASYGTLYRVTAEEGLISDEFAREVYPDWECAEWQRIELQFVVHDWNRLLTANLDRVVGQEARHRLMQGLTVPQVGSALDERFRWVKAILERLERTASEDQRYDVLSRCAHVFPREQIDKLRAVYVDTLAGTGNPLDAVDAVIAFMEEDPGWGQAPRREGRIVYSTKAPRDVQTHRDAQTPAEARAAYCYCPIVRNRLAHGMPAAFCYCGAGWFRQQWEGAIGRPVSISIEKSVLRGDDECQFAIRLPEDLGPGRGE